MPTITLSGGLDPKIGIELAFTKQDLISKISKESIRASSWPKDEIEAHVTNWLEAVLNVDITSTIAGNFRIEEIVALPHQHEAASPFNEAFPWGDISDLSKYGRKAVSNRNLNRVVWNVDASLAGQQQGTSHDVLAGRIRIKYQHSTRSDLKWHWDITLDQGCFEIQTRPSPVSHFNDFAFNIVRHHIMAGAQKAGLDDRSGLGGMQINVDFATGLNGNYLMILRTIAATERSRVEFRKLKQKNGVLTMALDGDTTFNAAYIKEDGRPLALAEELGELISAVIEAHQAQSSGLQEDDWLKGFFRTYRFLMRKYPTPEQFKQFAAGLSPAQVKRKVEAESKIADPDFDEHAPYNEEIERFQALNITNIRNNNPKLRRVEFRDFFAAYDVDDLGTAITYVYQILTEASDRHRLQRAETL